MHRIPSAYLSVTMPILVKRKNMSRLSRSFPSPLKINAAALPREAEQCNACIIAQNMPRHYYQTPLQLFLLARTAPFRVRSVILDGMVLQKISNLCHQGIFWELELI